MAAGIVPPLHPVLLVLDVRKGTAGTQNTTICRTDFSALLLN